MVAKRAILFSLVLALVACGGEEFVSGPQGDNGFVDPPGGAGMAGSAGGGGSGAGLSGSGGSAGVLAGKGGSSGSGGSSAGQSGAGASGAASGSGGDTGSGGSSGDGGSAGASAGAGGSMAGGGQGGSPGAGQGGSSGSMAGVSGEAGSGQSGAGQGGSAGDAGSGGGSAGVGGAPCLAELDAPCDPKVAEACGGLVCGCNGRYIKVEQEPWLICTTECGPFFAKEGEIAVCYRLPADEHGPEKFPEYPLWGLTGGISTPGMPLTEAYQNPIAGCVQMDPKQDHVLCRFKGSYEKGSGVVAHFAPHRFKNPGEAGPFVCGPDCCPGEAQIFIGNVSGGSYSSCLANGPGVSEEKDPLNASSEMVALDLDKVP